MGESARAGVEEKWTLLKAGEQKCFPAFPCLLGKVLSVHPPTAGDRIIIVICIARRAGATEKGVEGESCHAVPALVEGPDRGVDLLDIIRRAEVAVGIRRPAGAPVLQIQPLKLLLGSGILKVPAEVRATTSVALDVTPLIRKCDSISGIRRFSAGPVSGRLRRSLSNEADRTGGF